MGEFCAFVFEAEGIAGGIRSGRDGYEVLVMMKGGGGYSALSWICRTVFRMFLAFLYWSCGEIEDLFFLHHFSIRPIIDHGCLMRTIISSLASILVR